MSIIKIIGEYEFSDWVQNSDSYSNNFSFEGAKALQEYLEQLSDDIGEDIEFDPVAWCCEYSEYDSLAEAYKQWRYDYTFVEGEAKEYFNDNTIMIEVDNGHLIIRDF